jgi:hypothetical protein
VKTKLTVSNVDRYQQIAVSRLILFTTAQIHETFGAFQTWAAREVAQTGDADGNVAGEKVASLLPALQRRWRATLDAYTSLVRWGREQAGDIAFTPLGVRNNDAFPSPIVKLQEAFVPTQNDWLKLVELWVRRRNYALQVAQQRVYGDGMTLSQRIWRLDSEGFSRLRAQLAQGMIERTSAARLSKQVEEYLGADMDLPRWSYARLGKMTATERAQDLTGLIHDASKRTQGMAYNALRLARTEIQYANHAVTSDIAQHFPGIVGRYSRLSPAHPKLDICDQYAAGGPYEVTANFLPLHPQCMCRYEEKMMDPKAFAGAVRGWIVGENGFLDEYVQWLGLRQVGPFPLDLSTFHVMDLWLEGSTDAMAQSMRNR